MMEQVILLMFTASTKILLYCLLKLKQEWVSLTDLDIEQKNQYGWSAFSPVNYILAASVPQTPRKPSFISATDNSITI